MITYKGEFFPFFCGPKQRELKSKKRTNPGYALGIVLREKIHENQVGSD
jgi:hypothetical protein